MSRNETLSIPTTLLPACLKWLRLQRGRDSLKLEPVTRSNKTTACSKIV